MVSIGNRLRSLRKGKKLSQKDMAKLFNLAESTIGMYERDERKPDYETLNKFADYFNVSTDFILGRTNHPSDYNLAGISESVYSNLTPYQQEVFDFMLSREDLFFKDKPEEILEALEQFEIYYEVYKKQQEKKK